MRFWLCFWLLLASFGNAVAAGVLLLWDASPDAAAVGYAAYYGPVGNPTPSRIDVGNTTNTPVNNLQAGITYFFYVTAYDSVGNESDPSSVINYTVPIGGTNTPPVLVVISNQSATIGNSLTFTAVATDLQVPPQLLTFTLDNPPTNAMIDPASGVFNWIPVRAQVGTNYVIVRVTDNGSPALSATQAVQIIVQPRPVFLRQISG